MIIECEPSLLDSGVPTIAWIATHLRVSWLTPFIQAISDLGKEGQIIFTLAIAYWLWNKRYATYLGYAMFTALLVNFMLKGWVRECRPPSQYWLEQIHNSFSFPSGHTQVASPLWLGFAYYVRNKWLALTYLLIGLIIGLSRPYLGVHFVHDIVVGGILGVAIFAGYIVCEKKNWQLLQKLSMPSQTLMMILILGIYLLLLKDLHPSVIKGVCALVGFWLGCQCEIRWVQFTPPRTIASSLVMLLIGVTGILILWKGLPLLSQAEGLSIVQYVMLGAWITFVTPWLHKKVINAFSG